MSTICLAAQRSYATGEAVYFAYRLPDIRKVFSVSLLWFIGVCAFIAAGLYAHVFWNCRHPRTEVKPVHVEKSETRLSDMHYVYVSKPFPVPQPKAEPVAEPKAIPIEQDDPAPDSDSGWQQAPDGDSLSRQSLPGSENQSEDTSLKERFMQALKEQQEDYQQGKTPAPPEDETQAMTGSAESKDSPPIHAGIHAGMLDKTNASASSLVKGNNG